MQYRGRYVLGLLLTLAYTGCFQLIPLSVRAVVQRIQAQAGASAILDGTLVLVAVACALALTRISSRIVLFRAGRHVEFQLRNDLFDHLQRLPQSYFAVNRTGDLMSRAVNDINSVRMFLGMGLLNMVQTPILYLGAIAVMFTIDAPLTLCVLVPYLLLIGIGRVFGRRMHQANLGAQEQLGWLSAVAQQNAAGVLVVRAYGLESREEERFGVENDELYERQVRLAKINSSMMPVMTFLPALSMILVLLAGGARVQAGAVEQADLWAFYTYLFMLGFPTTMLGFVISITQRARAGMSRLNDILNTVPAIRDRADRVEVQDLAGRVEVRDLSFRFPGREAEPALRGLSFRVEPGQTVGIVGPVGAGKTTLVSAIPRLLDIEDDRVFVDSVDVNRLPLNLLRSSIAMVPQDSFLFSTTVHDNIAFGKPDAELAEIRAAAERAGICDEIDAFPNGFETLVGERGVTLSGGQRQRIALARALLLDPAILILDDSLSSVDAATEERILKELRHVREGLTSFIVAHRVSAVRDADLILVLEDGLLVEQGRHQELIQRDGFYARIRRQQEIEAEIESDL